MGLIIQSCVYHITDIYFFVGYYKRHAWKSVSNATVRFWGEVHAVTCGALTLGERYCVTSRSRPLDSNLSFELWPRIWLLSSILANLRRCWFTARILLTFRLRWNYCDLALFTRLCISRRLGLWFRHTLKIGKSIFFLFHTLHYDRSPSGYCKSSLSFSSSSMAFSIQFLKIFLAFYYVCSLQIYL